METPRIVITGVAGFIGSTLAYKLCSLGYNVIGIDKFLCGYDSNLSWVTPSHSFALHKMDMADPQVLSILQKNDVVFHLASFTALPSNQVDTVNSYTNNVLSTLAFLESCRKVGIQHFIFPSSCCVYENEEIKEPSKETNHVTPTLIYSLGKKHCEDLIESYYHNYGVPYTIFRLFNVYGPAADASRAQPGLIPYLITNLRAGKPIYVCADGEQKRDYLYISDLIELLVKMIQKGPVNTIVNACSGKRVSVNEICETVQRLLGTHENPDHKEPSCHWDKFTPLFEGPYPFKKSSVIHDVLKETLGSTDKVNELYGWHAKTSLSDGIAECIQKT